MKSLMHKTVVNNLVLVAKKYHAFYYPQPFHAALKSDELQSIVEWIAT